MEPNNFEKDFREKLNQRRIEPSEKAWDRLDAMLSVAEEKKPKNKNRWLYIAASIVGFLMVGTFFFNQEKKVELQKNQVVIEDNSQKDSVVKLGFKETDANKDQIAVSEKEPTQDAGDSKKEEKISNQKGIKVVKNTANPIAEVSVINQKNQQSPSLNNQITAPETVKNETADQLLNTAEKTVVAENTVKPKAKIKVNASDLLNQVDGELELSFREKVITKVNKNYQTVKVALANRNQKE
ncbi:hypothetical protein D0809_00575 [Flavobacterium circumlabens]|uniref:Uncharacterized protein n=1 Tax=Flavobacterium circumlabens TaxID=2133765 RepID=A0A4Y7UI43_9FLAO|nr:hypothetical protein [Flavobacterium circumlabens]TCN52578.1 hypothetical protein EV142_110118 [Flavobacterium circumlabens]TEB45538.1 hypothetical protein D0809_00575 [Flavobacterium circumlabens]